MSEIPLQVCEGQPTKATRMMQAEEAVSRIKVSNGWMKGALHNTWTENLGLLYFWEL